MIDDWIATIHPDDVPTNGTNDAGVPWSQIRPLWLTFCGFDTPSARGGHVNMSPSELDSWGTHECADKKSLEPQQVRDRVRKAATTHPQQWESYGDKGNDDPTTMGHVEIAKKSTRSTLVATGHGRRTANTSHLGQRRVPLAGELPISTGSRIHSGCTRLSTTMYTLRRVTDTLKFGVSCRSSRCTQLHYSHPTN